MHSEFLGRLQFWWLTFTAASANVLFVPQHFLGLAGMPCRHTEIIHKHRVLEPDFVIFCPKQ